MYDGFAGNLSSREAIVVESDDLITLERADLTHSGMIEGVSSALNDQRPLSL